MSMSIGEKIRKIRKELKLTQSQLAGNEMTKSMLSQIENNVASPSMKNLKYLADRLGKPIAYFLDDNYSKNDNISNDCIDSLLLEKISEVIKEVDNLIKKTEFAKAKAILVDLLKKSRINKESKIYADIIYKLGLCFGYLKDFLKSEEYINESIEIYEKNYLYSDAATAYMDLAFKAFASFNYDEALKILSDSYQIYQKSANRDIFFEIEFFHNKAGTLSALGQIENTLSILSKAIDLSKETNVYYKTDELYRMRSSIFLIIERYDDFLHNIKKARQFAEFTDNKLSIGSIEFNLAFYENIIGNPKKALEYLELSYKLLGENNYLYYQEKAKSYYLLEDYERALTIFNKAKYPDYVYHIFDYLILWSAKIYEGLTLHKLNKTNEAIKSIKEGILKMETVTQSKYLAFAYKSLSDIYSATNNYEEAFKSLRMSNAIEEKLKGLPY